MIVAAVKIVTIITIAESRNRLSINDSYISRKSRDDNKDGEDYVKKDDDDDDDDDDLDCDDSVDENRDENDNDNEDDDNDDDDDDTDRISSDLQKRCVNRFDITNLEKEDAQDLRVEMDRIARMYVHLVMLLVFASAGMKVYT